MSDPHGLTQQQWTEVFDGWIEEFHENFPDMGGSMRTSVHFNRGGFGGMVRGWIIDGEGTVHNYVLEGRYHSFARPPGPTIEVTKWLSYNEEYWEKILADRVGSVVIDRVHYRICAPGGGGHGGQRVTVQWLDGSESVTNNLWRQGPVPPPFRDRLPNNAKRLVWG